MNIIDRFRAYLSKCPGAISGHGGHPATFAVCCRAVEFGLAIDEALPLLLEWNERCQPRWTENALRHKLRSAFNHTQPKADFTNHDRPARTVSHAPAVKPSPTIAAANLPLDLRPFKLTAGNDGDHAMIAVVRHVSIAAVVLMVNRALLRFGHYRFKQYPQRPAWFVLDTRKRFAVVRRLDGEVWFDDVKALTTTSEPPANGAGVWPIGTMESLNFPCIALVEGGPDLLAAHEFIVRESREHDCAAVMMFSSAPQIHADALPHFNGKRVRIFTHSDDNGAGQKAASRWATQLESVGAVVGCYDCGSEAGKDLNDLAQLRGFNEPILP